MKKIERSKESLNPLGRKTFYPQKFDPNLLFCIPRKQNREKNRCLNNYLNNYEFFGYDLWRLYEVSFLLQRGKDIVPQNLMLQLQVNAHTSYIWESKSVKLFFFSLNQEIFPSKTQFLKRVHEPLNQGLHDGDRPLAQENNLIIQEFHNPAQDIEQQIDDIIWLEYLAPDFKLVRSGPSLIFGTKVFRSLCPVTGQPDWATVLIGVNGKEPDLEVLLKYLLNFREHQSFHEDCAESIFCHLWQTLSPNKLWVSMHFTRRGGIEINPIRFSPSVSLEDIPVFGHRFLPQ